MKETLEGRLQELVRTSAISEVGIGFHDLSSGATILIHGDVTFHAASMMKVPVMCEAFRQHESGEISLDAPISVRNLFDSIFDGSAYTLDPDDDSDKTLYELIGAQETARELVELMITNSSNLATNIMVDLLGAERVTGYMAQLGASGMRVARGVEDRKAFVHGLNNTATAGSYLRLMIALALGDVVSPDASKQMISVLSRQRHSEAIPAGLPADVRIAHKTGWNSDYYHDGGLVCTDGRPDWALAVFTKGARDMPAAHAFVASVARECWHHVRNENERSAP